MGGVGFYAIYAEACYLADQMAAGAYLVWQMF